jgi:propionyl-CoA synthetase
VVDYAAVLRMHGVKKGDVVVIYMPMIPEAAVAMLACARIGAVHSVVFGGFAANELAVRIRDSSSRIIITASCGIDGHKIVEYKPLVDAAIALASDEHTVEHCIVLQRPAHKVTLTAARDVDWEAAVGAARVAETDGGGQAAGQGGHCEELAATDPLYVLYTSGTTSAPKGIVRDNGGHAVAQLWAMESIFGMKEKDVFWAASDIGWVVGHSCAVYGPLLKGCTSVIYEGKPVGTPDAAAFWRVVEQHRVNALFCAPTAFRAIKLQDHEGKLPLKHDLSSLRHLFLAGERADSGTVHWAQRALGIPVLDNWWQTETGWPVCSNMVGVEGYLPTKMGSCYRPCTGWDLKVLKMHSSGLDDSPDASIEPELAEAGAVGALAVKLPLPPGFMSGLYNHDARFVKAYMAEYPGYYNTGDIGHIDKDGYVNICDFFNDYVVVIACNNYYNYYSQSGMCTSLPERKMK